jgi:tetratricopeptide (TPR) repeat protein
MPICHNRKPISLKIRFLIIFIAVNSLGAKPPEPDWAKRMDEFRALLSELLPNVISDEEFNSPKNFKAIETEAKKLAELAHGMPQGKLPDADPSINLIAGLFKNEINSAYNHLINGRREYARAVLKSVPRYCIACHTRSSSSLDLSSLQQEVPKVLDTALEKAEFFDATWQFERAMNEFEKILNDSKVAKDHQLEWQRAAYYAIATSVRVKRDPDRALAVVNLIIKGEEVPQFMKRDGLQWRESLMQWKTEAPHEFATANDLLNESDRLMSLAATLQKYPTDRSGDIFYLRASSYLHDFLTQYPESPNTAQALLMLGTCYEMLQAPELWFVHELYYEACIRKAPNTEIAQTCFTRYEQSIFFGYSGSSGISLPYDVKKNLKELKKLSTPS